MFLRACALAAPLLLHPFVASAEECAPRPAPAALVANVVETIAIPASDRVDAFGRTPDGQTVHRYKWNAHAHWEPWEILGRPGDRIAQGPWAASWAPGRYDVLAIAPDGTLLHLYMQQGRSLWICYENLWPQMRFKELREFRSDGPERLEVAAVAASGALLRMLHVGAWKQWTDATVNQDVATAKAHIDWAWNDHGPCSRFTLCATYFDSFGVNLKFSDGSVAPFAHISRLTTSAHDCIENARRELREKGDRAMAVQWVMASQIHNRPVWEWMRAHPDAVVTALLL